MESLLLEDESFLIERFHEVENYRHRRNLPGSECKCVSCDCGCHLRVAGGVDCKPSTAAATSPVSARRRAAAHATYKENPSRTNTSCHHCNCCCCCTSQDCQDGFFGSNASNKREGDPLLAQTFQEISRKATELEAWCAPSHLDKKLVVLQATFEELQQQQVQKQLVKDMEHVMSSSELTEADTTAPGSSGDGFEANPGNNSCFRSGELPFQLSELALASQFALRLFFRITSMLRNQRKGSSSDTAATTSGGSTASSSSSHASSSGNSDRLLLQIAQKMPSILAALPPFTLSPGFVDVSSQQDQQHPKPVGSDSSKQLASVQQLPPSPPPPRERQWSVFEELFSLFREFVGSSSPGTNNSEVVKQTSNASSSPKCQTISDKDRSSLLVALTALSLKSGRMSHLLCVTRLLLESSNDELILTEDLVPLLDELQNATAEINQRPFLERKLSGTLMSFGKGDHGKLGHGQCSHSGCSDGNCTENKLVATLIAGTKDVKFTKIDSLSTHSVAITSKGDVMSWGNGDKYRLGHGSASKEYSPRIVEFFCNKGRVSDVACGLGHTLALMATGELYGWGNGSNGRLGLGDANDRSTPTKISLPDSLTPGPTTRHGGGLLTQVYCGASHSLGISSEGRVYAWGKNNQGQCGHGHTNDVFTVEEIRFFHEETDERVIQADGGWEHTLFATASGHAYSCGSGYKDSRRAGIPPVLGHGDCERRLKPTLIQPLADNDEIAKVSCGWDHSLAISTSGAVYSWGSGSNGKLGHGDEDNLDAPQVIRALEGKQVMDVKAGCEHTVFLTNDNELYTCGQGDSGRLGHGDSTTRKLPTLVESLVTTGTKPLAIAVGDKYNLVLVEETRTNATGSALTAASNGSESPIKSSMKGGQSTNKNGAMQRSHASKARKRDLLKQIAEEEQHLIKPFDHGWLVSMLNETNGHKSPVTCAKSCESNQPRETMCPAPLPQTRDSLISFLMLHLDRLSTEYFAAEHEQMSLSNDLEAAGDSLQQDPPHQRLKQEQANRMLQKPFAIEMSIEFFQLLHCLLQVNWNAIVHSTKKIEKALIAAQKASVCSQLPAEHQSGLLNYAQQTSLVVSLLRVLKTNLLFGIGTAFFRANGCANGNGMIDESRKTSSSSSALKTTMTALRELLSQMASFKLPSESTKTSSHGEVWENHIVTVLDHCDKAAEWIEFEACQALKIGFDVFYSTIPERTALLWRIIGPTSSSCSSAQTRVLANRLCEDDVLEAILNNAFGVSDPMAHQCFIKTKAPCASLDNATISGLLNEPVDLMHFISHLLGKCVERAELQLSQAFPKPCCHAAGPSVLGFTSDCYLQMLSVVQAHLIGSCYQILTANTNVHPDAGQPSRSTSHARCSSCIVDLFFWFLERILTESSGLLRKLHKATCQHEEVIVGRLHGTFLQVLFPNLIESIAVFLLQLRDHPPCGLTERSDLKVIAGFTLKSLELVTPLLLPMLKMLDEINWKMRNVQDINSNQMGDVKGDCKWIEELEEASALLCGKYANHLLSLADGEAKSATVASLHTILVQNLPCFQQKELVVLIELLFGNGMLKSEELTSSPSSCVAGRALFKQWEANGVFEMENEIHEEVDMESGLGRQISETQQLVWIEHQHFLTQFIALQHESEVAFLEHWTDPSQSLHQTVEFSKDKQRARLLVIAAITSLCIWHQQWIDEFRQLHRQFIDQKLSQVGSWSQSPVGQLIREVTRLVDTHADWFQTTDSILVAAEQVTTNCKFLLSFAPSSHLDRHSTSSRTASAKDSSTIFEDISRGFEMLFVPMEIDSIRTAMASKQTEAEFFHLGLCIFHESLRKLTSNPAKANVLSELVRWITPASSGSSCGKPRGLFTSRFGWNPTQQRRIWKAAENVYIRTSRFLASDMNSTFELKKQALLLWSMPLHGAWSDSFVHGGDDDGISGEVIDVIVKAGIVGALADLLQEELDHLQQNDHMNALGDRLGNSSPFGSLSMHLSSKLKQIERVLYGISPNEMLRGVAWQAFVCVSLQLSRAGMHSQDKSFTNYLLGDDTASSDLSDGGTGAPLISPRSSAHLLLNSSSSRDLKTSFSPRKRLTLPKKTVLLTRKETIELMYDFLFTSLQRAMTNVEHLHQFDRTLCAILGTGAYEHATHSCNLGTNATKSGSSLKKFLFAMPTFLLVHGASLANAQVVVRENLLPRNKHQYSKSTQTKADKSMADAFSFCCWVFAEPVTSKSPVVNAAGGGQVPSTTTSSPTGKELKERENRVSRGVCICALSRSSSHHQQELQSDSDPQSEEEEDKQRFFVMVVDQFQHDRVVCRVAMRSGNDHEADTTSADAPGSPTRAFKHWHVFPFEILLVINKWTHLALVVSNKEQTARVFVNGVQVDEQRHVAVPWRVFDYLDQFQMGGKVSNKLLEQFPAPTCTTATNPNASSNQRGYDTVDTNRGACGIILDDVLCFDTALSVQQLQLLGSSGGSVLFHQKRIQDADQALVSTIEFLFELIGFQHDTFASTNSVARSTLGTTLRGAKWMALLLRCLEIAPSSCHCLLQFLLQRLLPHVDPQAISTELASTSTSRRPPTGHEEATNPKDLRQSLLRMIPDPLRINAMLSRQLMEQTTWASASLTHLLWQWLVLKDAAGGKPPRVMEPLYLLLHGASITTTSLPSSESQTIPSAWKDTVLGTKSIHELLSTLPEEKQRHLFQTIRVALAVQTWQSLLRAPLWQPIVQELLISTSDLQQIEYQVLHPCRTNLPAMKHDEQDTLRSLQWLFTLVLGASGYAENVFAKRQLLLCGKLFQRLNPLVNQRSSLVLGNGNELHDHSSAATTSIKDSVCGLARVFVAAPRSFALTTRQELAGSKESLASIESHDYRMALYGRVRALSMRVAMVTMQTCPVPTCGTTKAQDEAKYWQSLLDLASMDSFEYAVALLGLDPKTAMKIRPLRYLLDHLPHPRKTNLPRHGHRIASDLCLDDLEELSWEAWEALACEDSFSEFYATYGAGSFGPGVRVSSQPPSRYGVWWEPNANGAPSCCGLEVVTGEIEIHELRVKALQHFPTVRASTVAICASTGLWFYEALILSDGLMQIGYITNDFEADATQGQGVGDNLHSWAFDGFRRKKWNVASYEYGENWCTGDVVGVLLDTDRMELSFFLNGRFLGVAFTGIPAVSTTVFYPAASLNMDQMIQFNFGTALKDYATDALSVTANDSMSTGMTEEMILAQAQQQQVQQSFLHLPSLVDNETGNEGSVATSRIQAVAMALSTSGAIQDPQDEENEDEEDEEEETTGEEGVEQTVRHHLGGDGEVDTTSMSIHRTPSTSTDNGSVVRVIQTTIGDSMQKLKEWSQNLVSLGFPQEWVLRCAAAFQASEILHESDAVTWILEQMEKEASISSSFCISQLSQAASPPCSTLSTTHATAVSAEAQATDGLGGSSDAVESTSLAADTTGSVSSARPRADQNPPSGMDNQRSRTKSHSSSQLDRNLASGANVEAVPSAFSEEQAVTPVNAYCQGRDTFIGATNASAFFHLEVDSMAPCERTNTLMELKDKLFCQPEKNGPSDHHRRMATTDPSEPLQQLHTISRLLLRHQQVHQRHPGGLLPLCIALDGLLTVEYARQTLVHLLLHLWQQQPPPVKVDRLQPAFVNWLVHSSEMQTQLVRFIRGQVSFGTVDASLAVPLDDILGQLMWNEIESQGTHCLLDAVWKEIDVHVTHKSTLAMDPLEEHLRVWVEWLMQLILPQLERLLLLLDGSASMDASTQQYQSVRQTLAQKVLAGSFYLKWFQIATKARCHRWRHLALQIMTRLLQLCGDYSETVSHLDAHATEPIVALRRQLLQSTQVNHLLTYCSLRLQQERTKQKSFSLTTLLYLQLLFTAYQLSLLEEPTMKALSASSSLPSVVSTTSSSRPLSSSIHARYELTMDTITFQHLVVSWHALDQDKPLSNHTGSSEASPTSLLALEIAPVRFFAHLEEPVTGAGQHPPDGYQRIMLFNSRATSQSFTINNLKPDTKYHVRLVEVSGSSQPVGETSAYARDDAVKAQATVVAEAEAQTLCEPLFELDCLAKGSNLEVFNQNLTVRNKFHKKWHSIRASVCFAQGIHQWQVRIDKCVSKNIFIGICSEDAQLDNYIGSDAFGWGFLANKAIWHNKTKLHGYGEIFKQGDLITVILDCHARTLAFCRNGEFLGIAATNLQVPKEAASSVMSGTTVTSNSGDNGISTTTSPPPATMAAFSGSGTGATTVATPVATSKWFPAFSLYNKDDQITLIPPNSTSFVQLQAGGATVMELIQEMRLLAAYQAILKVPASASVALKRAKHRVLCELLYEKVVDWHDGTLIWREMAPFEIEEVHVCDAKLTKSFDLTSGDWIQSPRGKSVILGLRNHQVYYEMVEAEPTSAQKELENYSMGFPSARRSISCCHAQTCRDLRKANQIQKLTRQQDVNDQDSSDLQPRSGPTSSLPTLPFDAFEQTQWDWNTNAQWKVGQMDSKLISLLDSLTISKNLKTPYHLTASQIRKAFEQQETHALWNVTTTTRTSSSSSSADSLLHFQQVLWRIGVVCLFNKSVNNVLRFFFCDSSSLQAPGSCSKGSSTGSLEVFELAQMLLFAHQKHQFMKEILAQSLTTSSANEPTFGTARDSPAKATPNDENAASTSPVKKNGASKSPKKPSSRLFHLGIDADEDSQLAQVFGDSFQDSQPNTSRFTALLPTFTVPFPFPAGIKPFWRLPQDLWYAPDQTTRHQISQHPQQPPLDVGVDCSLAAGELLFERFVGQLELKPPRELRKQQIGTCGLENIYFRSFDLVETTTTTASSSSQCASACKPASQEDTTSDLDFMHALATNRMDKTDPNALYMSCFEQLFREIQSPSLPFFVPKSSGALSASKTNSNSNSDAMADFELVLNDKVLDAQTLQISASKQLSRVQKLQWLFHVGQLLGIAWRSQLLLPLEFISMNFWHELLGCPHEESTTPLEPVDKSIATHHQELMASIRRGFYVMIPSVCVQVLTANEFRKMLCAVDLAWFHGFIQANTHHHQHRDPVRRQHVWFWQLVEDFCWLERRSFVRWITQKTEFFDEDEEKHELAHLRLEIHELVLTPPVHHLSQAGLDEASQQQGEQEKAPLQEQRLDPQETVSSSTATASVSSSSSSSPVQVSSAEAATTNDVDAAFPMVQRVDATTSKLFLPAYSTRLVLQRKLALVMANSGAMI